MKTLLADDITVVILAGGKGRRMGGQDKGLISYKGSALISQVIETISQQTDKIIINANRNLTEYSKFGYPVIEDTLDGFQGPLAGFLAAMECVHTEYILTLPCDGPAMSENYVHNMLETMNHCLAESGCELVVASDHHRMQPVYALIPVHLKPSLTCFLRDGGRKIDAWYQQHRYALANFSQDTDVFTNINSPQDLL